MFTNLINNINIKTFSRMTSVGSVFANNFNRSNRDLLKKPVFEKGDGKCVDVLPTTTKQYYNTIHSSTKLRPIQPSFKKNERHVYQKVKDRRKKENQNIKFTISLEQQT